MATTWTHLAARAVVTPLIGTGVTPNHLTTLRLLTGLGACVAVALGTPAGDLWGGLLWLISAFLDRADGELARVGNMMSAKGHAYDYASDAIINALIFFAAGVGARHSWLGVSAIGLGALATAAMAVCWVCGEIYQKLDNSGQKAYAGKWGFDLDDGLYLLAPFIWFGLMSFVVLGGAVATTVMAVVILVRLRLLRARIGRTSASTQKQAEVNLG
jgi:archaetidylinositol phosphate synthase